jgi:uncharacterized protein (TIGR00730 family)
VKYNVADPGQPQAAAGRASPPFPVGWVCGARDYRRMADEFARVHTERLLAAAGKHVVLIGSSRTPADDQGYLLAYETSRAFARAGWTVVSGGGPGVMAAAAQGAGPGRCIAVGLEIPGEQNDAAAGALGSTLATSFFARKSAMFHDCSAFICLPGGIGTMDELTEILVLQHTGRIRPAPIVLLAPPGNHYWLRWLDFLRTEVVGSGFCGPSVLTRMTLTDSAEECWRVVDRFYSNVVDVSLQPGPSVVLRLRRELTDDALGTLLEWYRGGCVADTGSLHQRASGGSTTLSFAACETFHERLHELIADVNAATGAK